MRHLRLAFACCLGAATIGLAGCGSSDSPAPPYTLSCTTHRLPGGRIRASVTVQNTTSAAGSPIIFGPALQWVRHTYPVLPPNPVRVASTSYIGLRVPRIRPGKAAHLLLRFAQPPGPQPLAVTAASPLTTAGTDPFTNSGCTIKRIR